MNTYKGSCIFVDHSSGYIFVEHQLGFLAIETIQAMQAFERFALSVGVYIQSYLTNSGVFKETSFVKHFQDHNQHIQYCGVNVHHKSGVAESAVRSVSNMAQTILLHASCKWRDGIDSLLWPMVVIYVVYLFNHLPNAQKLCPANIFNDSKSPRIIS
jgi:hypothetical protein